MRLTVDVVLVLAQLAGLDQPDVGELVLLRVVAVHVLIVLHLLIVDGLHLDHRVVGQLPRGGERLERMPEVVLLVQFGRLQRERVDQQDVVGDAQADHDLADVAQVLGQCAWQAHDVVLADGHHLHRVGELVLVRVRVRVVRDQLLRRRVPTRYDRLQEIDELHGVVFLVEVEIDAGVLRLDVHGVRVRLVLDDQLLQIEQRLLVLCLLSHLHHCSPVVVRLLSMTGLAEQILHYVLADEHLLQNGAVEHLLLDGQLDLQSLRVRLGVQEHRVDQVHLVHVLQLLYAEG